MYNFKSNMPLSKVTKDSVRIEKGIVYLTTNKRPFYNLFVKKMSNKKAKALFNSVKGMYWYDFTFYEFFLPIIVKGIENHIEWLLDDNTIKGKRKQTAIPALSAVKHMLIENTWLKKTYSEKRFPKQISMDVIHKIFNWKPLPHQQVAIDNHAEIKERFGLRGLYIDGAIGSGKTVLSLMMAYGQEADHIVVFAPNSTIKDVWEETLTSDAFKVKQGCWVVKGYSVDKHGVKTKGDYKHQKVILANFESASKLSNILPKLRGKVVYIVDEAHSLNDKKSRTSQMIQDYVTQNNPDDIILMSGTPLKMNQSELIPLITILDPKFNKHARRRYEILFRGGNRILSSAIPDIYARYRVIVKPKEDSSSIPPLTEITHKQKVENEEEFYISKIRDDMDEYIDKRAKEDKPNILKMENEYRALRQIAFDRLAKTVPLNILKQHAQEVEDVKKQYKGTRLDNYFDLLQSVRVFESQVIEPILDIEDRKRFRVLKTMYKYPMLKYLGEALGTIVTQARISASVAMVKAVDLDNLISSSEKKVLVFTNYIAVAEEALGRSKAYRGVGIYGETAKDLQRALVALEQDEFDYIVSTYRILGTGVPVTMASTIVAFEKPFRDYLWLQAKGRIHRQGQTSPTFVITFEMDTGENANIYNRTEDLLSLSRWNVKQLTSGTSIIDTISLESEATPAMLDESPIDAYSRMCVSAGLDEFDILNEHYNFNNKGYTMDISKEELYKMDNVELVTLTETFNDDLLTKRVKSLEVTDIYKDKILNDVFNHMQKQTLVEKLNEFTELTKVNKLEQPKITKVEHEVTPYLLGNPDANVVYECLHEAFPVLDENVNMLNALLKEVKYVTENEDVVLSTPNKINLDKFKVLQLPNAIKRQEFTLEADDFRLQRYNVTCDLLNELHQTLNVVKDKEAFYNKYNDLAVELNKLKDNDEVLVNLRNAYVNISK